MSADPAARPRRSRFSLLVDVVVVLALAAISAPIVLSALSGADTWSGFRTPDWALLARQSLALQIHVAAVLLAFLVGLGQMLGPKGTLAHRTIGWLWVIAMGATAVSSLFIRNLNHAGFSLIHVLSIWTLINLPVAVWAARTHRVETHRRAMRGLFFGAILIAGAFALLPGRLLWRVFVG
jgi:uncharacterized membrane protein